MLGDIALLTRFDESRYEPWPALLTLTEEQYVTYRGQSGRFEAEVDFPLMQTRIRGTLPLVTGAALDDAASRIEIVRVERRTDAQVVAARWWQARSVLARDRRPELEFVLRNPARGEALTATRRAQAPGLGTSGSVMVGSPAAIPLALLSRGSPGPPSNGFAVQTELLDFPLVVSPGGTMIRIDRAWLDEAEVVVLEAIEAGMITRPLTIEDFVIPN